MYDLKAKLDYFSEMYKNDLAAATTVTECQEIHSAVCKEFLSLSADKEFIKYRDSNYEEVARQLIKFGNEQEGVLNKRVEELAGALLENFDLEALFDEHLEAFDEELKNAKTFKEMMNISDEEVLKFTSLISKEEVRAYRKLFPKEADNIFVAFAEKYDKIVMKHEDRVTDKNV